VIDSGNALVADGTLLDFTVHNVQPWLDIQVIGSTVIAVAADAETAKKYSTELAEKLFANRDGYWPDLMTVDEIIDLAEANTSGKPVILVDAADSPNGGAVGDSPVVAMRLLERGSKVRAGMFIQDPEAVKAAFRLGVGGTGELTVGACTTPDMPGPLKAVGTVRSLHDGNFIQEGPAGRGNRRCIGLSAVVSFGTVDVLLCTDAMASGDPQLLRHFGIEPSLYDLIVVKANTSFLVPYSKFAGPICYADTPGAGASNLKLFNWKRLPKGMYPFDLPEGYTPEPAKLTR
jgi:microcystin degradation protein MlrC